MREGQNVRAVKARLPKQKKAKEFLQERWDSSVLFASEEESVAACEKLGKGTGKQSGKSHERYTSLLRGIGEVKLSIKDDEVRA